MHPHVLGPRPRQAYRAPQLLRASASACALGLTLAMLAGCELPSSDAQVTPAPSEAPPRAAEFRSPEVEQALSDAEQVVRTRGFEGEGEPWRGFLVRGAAEVTGVAMHASTCYLLAAAGSRALLELDLRVHDSDGGEIARDDMAGPYAALRFCPPQSGRFYVAAHAAKGSGLFGMRRYAGPTGLHVRLDDLFERPAATKAVSAVEDTP